MQNQDSAAHESVEKNPKSKSAQPGRLLRRAGAFAVSSPFIWLFCNIVLGKFPGENSFGSVVCIGILAVGWALAIFVMIGSYRKYSGDLFGKAIVILILNGTLLFFIAKEAFAVVPPQPSLTGVWQFDSRLTHTVSRFEFQPHNHLHYSVSGTSPLDYSGTWHAVFWSNPKSDPATQFGLELQIEHVNDGPPQMAGREIIFSIEDFDGKHFTTRDVDEFQTFTRINPSASTTINTPSR